MAKKVTSGRKKGAAAKSRQWEESSNPEVLLGLLPIIPSLRRKRQLCAIGSCCLTWDAFPPPWQAVLGSVEALADGLLTERERDALIEAARSSGSVGPFYELLYPIYRQQSHLGLREVVRFVAGHLKGPRNKYLCELIRDIFGNPFRPVTLDPRWLTSPVVDLAGAINSERAFDRLPILSDALMDAGCDSDPMLQHCRGPEPHVRGCWVVDLLLGKE